MCSSSSKLHFCTCSTEIPRNEVSWVLERRENKIDSPIVGLWMLPVDRTLADFTIDDILHILRYESPFDWNYLPREGDEFSLKYDGAELRGYEYCYTNGKWCVADEDNYVNDGYLLRIYKEGEVLLKTYRTTTVPVKIKEDRH